MISSASELLKTDIWLNRWLVIELLFNANTFNDDLFQVLINFLEMRDDENKELKIALIKGDEDSVSLLKISILLTEVEVEDNHEKIEEPSLFHYAFCRFNIENRKKILKILIEKGLNTLLPDKLFLRNLTHQFLKDYANTDDIDLVDIVDMLLKSGVPLDKVDDKEFTILHYAVELKSPKLITFLIDEKL